MTVVPMPEPDKVDFDLDAVVAESEDKTPFTFRFGGDIYELPKSPDLRAFALLGTSDVTQMNDGLRALLGQEQWARIVASDTVLSDETFAVLMARYETWLGTTAGESSASSSSSTSTARQSKPT